jgi:outer membrane protein insertion porin family
VMRQWTGLIFNKNVGGFLGQALRDRASARSGRTRRGRAGVAGWLVLLLMTGMALAQTSGTPTVPGQTAPPDAHPMQVPQASTAQQTQQGRGNGDLALGNLGPGLSTSVWQWKGLHVEKIRFEGVTFGPEELLPRELAQRAGEALDPAKVRDSVRRLFASGRYRDIEVRGVRQGDNVTLIFAGPPQYFVGRVTIEGVRSDRLASLLRYSTRLTPGTALTDDGVAAGSDGIKQILQQQGYFESTVSVRSADVEGHQRNLFYTVNLGPQARVGEVTLQGNDPGMTVEEFRKKGKLKTGNRVTRDTTSNAIERLRAQFQKRNRLKATVSLQNQTYVASRNQVDYDFHADQGPEVQVLVEGAKVSKSRLHLLVPVFEEGTIDNDLLNEGVFNIRDYMQQQGYFDAKVDVKMIGGTDSQATRVVFTVDRGLKHKVVSVDLKGNKYFEDELLRERMQVRKADAYLRNGRYSPALVSSDVKAILSLYRANGFDKAEVKTTVRDSDTHDDGEPLKVGQIAVTYVVIEGPQQKFGVVNLAGVDKSRLADITALMNAQQGQPFSLVTLSGDRDAVLGYYLSHGFDQAKVEIKQLLERSDPTKTDVSLNVVEGQQVFVDKVLLSGVDRTRPNVVQNQILVHSGDPLDQSALLQTQRNLYGVTLFNEVVTAVQNPAGDTPQKNVLVQVTEAKRWNVTYGFGFEAQTGTPTQGMISEASRIQLGLPPNETITQEGKTGVSPRVSLDVSRINLRGTENSITLRSAYGLLEQTAIVTFQNPHFLGRRSLTGSISGGYSNVQDITTFSSSTLQGVFRVTQRLRRDTLIYDFQYRRVKVDPNSLQVSADLIPLLSQPVRVGGPGFSWFHDTRSPGPLDAVKGSYSGLQMFLASSKFGSQTDFWRIDGSNSTYYQFGKNKYVIARNTRIGYERASGPNPNAGSSVCQGPDNILLTTNPSCNAVPLPERLYAGGASSHRGFPINGAGPRDLQTGYPVGGSAVIVNSLEFRMPAPTLPYVGNSVSFVLFHDMGNVFQNASDLFPSFLNFRQPNRSTCRDVSGTIGTCSFNYYSHAVGLGARYRTPIGPIRVDFSYNLNPPIYPVIYDFNNNPPHVGQAGHFNFFFSIGQTF